MNISDLFFIRLFLLPIIGPFLFLLIMWPIAYLITVKNKRGAK